MSAPRGGKPIVVSDADGFLEVIRHNENGLITRRGDPAPIAEALDILYSDKYLCERIGRNARVYAEKKLSWSSVARQTLDVYEKMQLSRKRKV